MLKRHKHGPKKVDPDKVKTGPLTAQQEMFCLEYIVDLNAMQAVLRAGYRMTLRSASAYANKLMNDPRIQARIQEHMDKRLKRLEITADNVLKTIRDRAMGDARELTELRVGCCRYCHGTDQLYQRTKGEMRRARVEHEANCLKAGVDLPFNEQGGDGYDKRLDPHPECPECAGEGEPRVVFKDVRNYSETGANLYQGAKITRNGIEIGVHNSDKALEMLARHLNLYQEKVVEVTVTDKLATRLQRARERAGK